MNPLDDLKPWPEGAYSGLDLNRLAVYALSWIQEKRVPANFENLVVLLYRMFPAKFSLVNYPEYPDATRVNRALLQLQPKYRNWARGNVQKGYTLTETGRVVVGQTKTILESFSGAAGSAAEIVKRKAPKARTRDPHADLADVDQSTIFKLFQEGKQDQADSTLIWELLRAYPYTPKKALRERLRLLENVADLAGRGDVKQFLSWVKTRYATVLMD